MKHHKSSNRVSASKMYDLVLSYRRRGMTASFGVDVDPKRQQH